MLCPRVYPQDTHTVPRIHKQRYRPLTWECKRRFPKGDRKALWSRPQTRNPLRHEKSSRIGKKHMPKSASRKEVPGKNRKFPYHPFYHENPHLKSPKIPPIPCQAPHGASKQGCKSAFGTLAALLLYYFQMKMRKQMAQVNLEIVLFRHNRNGAVIVCFLVEALHIWMLENAVWAALERKKARAQRQSGRVSISFHIPCRHALIRIRRRVEGFARLHRQASARESQQHVHAAGGIVDDLAADAQQIPVFIRRHPAARG